MIRLVWALSHGLARRPATCCNLSVTNVSSTCSEPPFWEAAQQIVRVSVFGSNVNVEEEDDVNS